MGRERSIDEVELELEASRRRIVELEAIEVERQRSEERLRDNQERYRALFKNNPIETIIVDKDAKVADYNLAKERSGDRLPNIGDVMYRDYAGKHEVDMHRELLECIKTGMQKEFSERKYGNKYLLIRISPYSGGAIITMLDITHRKLLEAKLLAASISDELTGIFNRRGFFTMADRQVKAADRSQEYLFLLYADLDNMKWINDTLGHSTGDSALVETAEILRNTFRKSDIIGRLGGDEFAVLLSDRPGANSVEAVIERFEENIQAANGLSERTYTLSISIGVTRYDPKSPCTIEELMTRADTLMYENKKSKKDLPD